MRLSIGQTAELMIAEWRFLIFEVKRANGRALRRSTIINRHSSITSAWWEGRD